MRHQEGIGQQPEDTIEFVEVLQKHGVKTMLQIGVATGQDAAIFLECLPGLRWRGLDCDPKSGAALGPNTNFCYLDRVSSRHPQEVERFTDCEPWLDCLFIDGDHSFDGVAFDYSVYSPAVKKGGLIAFHDINVLAMLSWDGVGPQPVGLCHAPLFWDALKRVHGSEREIGRGPNGAHLVSRTGRRREGIGVIVK